MIVNKKFLKISVPDLILVALSLFFLVGITCIFDACPPKSDGTYMNCYYAGEVVTAIAALLLALSVAHVFLPSGEIKMGLDVGMVGISAVCAAVPKTIIPLCMMNTMDCNASMRPWTIAVCVVLIVACLADFVFFLRKRK
ncbi:MAG: DUF4418 family protein [Clostridia bacterium]|nr:DUF4418 family protein [Clostridia bacterium]